MLTEEEKEGVHEQLKRKKGKPNVQRFKGLGKLTRCNCAKPRLIRTLAVWCS
ncbi:hypothetical protein ACLK19_20180 [Escherichia coli]